MGRLLLGLGLALASAAHAAPAAAGAWLAPEEGQEIITSTAGKRNGYTTFESSAYWEAPLAEGVTGVIAPWSESAADLESGWRGEAIVGIKRAIFRDDENVMALQTSAFWRSDPPGDCGEGGLETRLLAGRGIGGGFLNVEIAARVLDEGCPAGRLNISAGYRPHERWLAMGEIFYETPREGSESLKLQVSVVRFGRDGRGIQVGLRTRLDGAAETALVLGMWGRPGG
jgi:hypothetical protein